MSRNLSNEQKSNLSQALDRFIEAGEELKKAPKFSTRADIMVGNIATQVEMARKIKAEVGDGLTPDTPPDAPDSNRGDFDNKNESIRSSVPQGLTSTYSQQGRNAKAQAEFGQNNKNLPREAERNLTPGLSGHPVKKDDTERRGNTFTVDSTSHREAREGEMGRVNADTLPLGNDEGQQQEFAAIVRGQPAGAVNVSDPIKQGADTTNTSSEGAGKPDNFFAEQAAQIRAQQDQDDKDGDAARQNELEFQAARGQKYDSANRVKTETIGHAAEKEKQAAATANDNPGDEKGKQAAAEANKGDKPAELKAEHQSDGNLDALDAAAKDEEAAGKKAKK